MTSSTKNEAAEKWCSEEGFYPDPKQGFIASAKWQQEQDKNKYSKDEVIAFVKWMYDYKADINKVEELFNQFKKK
jgi:hypothetical protein